MPPSTPPPKPRRRVTRGKASSNGSAGNGKLTDAAEVMADGKRTIELTSADSYTPRAVRWLWASRIPLRTLTMLAGPGGLGKSTFMARIVAKATTGKLDGALRGVPANVIIASAEDTIEEVLVPRLMSAGADLSRVHFIKLTRDGETGMLTFPGDIDLLEKALRGSDIKLLVLDPVVSFIEDATNSNIDHEVRRVLAPITAMAERTESAVVGLMHVNKKDSKSVLERVSASIAFVNAPRSVFLFAPHPDAESDEDERRVLAHAKSNWGPLQQALTVRIEQDSFNISTGEMIVTNRATLVEESNLHIEQLLTRRSPTEALKSDEAAEFLTAALSKGPRLVSELKAEAKAADVSWATVEKVRVKLGIVSWRLKEFQAPATWGYEGSEKIRLRAVKDE